MTQTKLDLGVPLPDPPTPRGFGALSPTERREVARRGGIAAHQKGRAHTFTTEEARIAGAKGGAKVAANRRHMAAIGKIGGAAKKSKGDPPSAAKEDQEPAKRT